LRSNSNHREQTICAGLQFQRWLNSDPIGELGFLALHVGRITGKQEPNLYRFVGNAPLSDEDLWGLSAKSICKKIGEWIIGKGKEKAKEKAIEKAKEILAEIFGGNIDDAKASCDAINNTKPEDMAPGQWETECMACAAYQCATSATTVAAAKNCLQQKMVKCDAGIKP
jgi:hypothetical protein